MSAVIWIDVTGRYCRDGINEFWHYEPTDRGYVIREWFALRRRKHREAYEWRYQAEARHVGYTFRDPGVYIRPAGLSGIWRHALTYLPPGVTSSMEVTHPYVTFHYERR